MTRKSIKVITALVLVLTFMFSISTTAFAVTADNCVAVDATNSVAVNASGTRTFVMFDGEESGCVRNYSINVGHACDCKLMFIGFYTSGGNSNDGVSVTIWKTGYSQKFDFKMNGQTSVVSIGRLNAGLYNVTIKADDAGATCVFGGSIYSQNY